MDNKSCMCAHIVQRSSLENGRSAAAAFARMRAALEYGQVPSALVPALVRALLGALHIRCAAAFPGAGCAGHSYKHGSMKQWCWEWRSQQQAV